MKNLIKDYQGNMARLREINDGAQGREFTEEEQSEIKALRSKCEKLDNEMFMERNAMKIEEQPKAFSFMRSINEAMKSENKSAKIELRTVGSGLGIAVNSSTGLGGGNAINTETLDIVTDLNEKMAIPATIMTVDNQVQIPIYTGAAAAWADDLEEVSAATGTMAKKTLKPHRIAAVLRISKALLKVANPTTEALLKNDLIEKVAGKLQAAFVSATEETTTTPGGIFNGKSEKAINYVNIVDAVASLEGANVNSPKVIIGTPANVAALKKDSLDSKGLLRTYENGMVDGMKVIGIPSAAGWAVLDPKEVIVTFFGPADVIVTENGEAARAGAVEITVNLWADIQVRRDSAVAAYANSAS